MAETLRHNRSFDTWTFWPAYLGAYFLHAGVYGTGTFWVFWQHGCSNMGTLQDFDCLGKDVFHHHGILAYVLYVALKVGTDRIGD